nr:MAG TPA: hypothetical protein [Caudoviricetes sp.]
MNGDFICDLYPSLLRLWRIFILFEFCKKDCICNVSYILKVVILINERW